MKTDVFMRKKKTFQNWSIELVVELLPHCVAKNHLL